jgi:hypothetical protein
MNLLTTPVRSCSAMTAAAAAGWCYLFDHAAVAQAQHPGRRQRLLRVNRAPDGNAEDGEALAAPYVLRAREVQVGQLRVGAGFFALGTIYFRFLEIMN